MFPAEQGMPTPLATLDNLLDAGDASEKAHKVFIGHNLGHRTFLMNVPMHEFYSISEVANDRGRDGETVAQRKLDPKHAEKLAAYLLKGLVSAAIARRQIKQQPIPTAFNQIAERLGRQPYMSIQPIVANIRNCDPAGANIRGERLMANDETASFKVYLSQKHVLWIIDGQHRRKGMQLLFDFLETIRNTHTYPKKGGLYPSQAEQATSEELAVWNDCFDVARSYCTTIIEVHLGLEPDQERQLFHDLNNLSKKVESSLALQFDSANPLNLFIKERLINDLSMQVVEKDVTDWHEDTGALSRKDLVAINAILFLNKTNIGGATPPMVNPKVEVAYQFWETVNQIPGFGEAAAKEKTVTAQPVVLKALAKLVYDFGFSPRRSDEGEAHLETLFSRLTDIDFGHDNPMWRYYEMTEEERETADLATLKSYLPAQDGANRDIGKFQAGVMRFGAKHNDIYPLLGDMIRWRLGLQNRHSA